MSSESDTGIRIHQVESPSCASQWNQNCTSAKRALRIYVLDTSVLHWTHNSPNGYHSSPLDHLHLKLTDNYPQIDTIERNPRKGKNQVSQVSQGGSELEETFEMVA
ncbi:hypothetical protein QAD02_021162 [Eretmocerus hayati]|uniref:Uncharacterized protein n=1 Tax=Eretmocerus hayati TaxID=131215 RepID=A0ACC2PRZ8_9HYME|nr:hypothetical protein QAD02_021162 [Eretmocerus hayati]